MNLLPKIKYKFSMTPRLKEKPSYREVAEYKNHELTVQKALSVRDEISQSMNHYAKLNDTSQDLHEGQNQIKTVENENRAFKIGQWTGAISDFFSGSEERLFVTTPLLLVTATVNPGLAVGLGAALLGGNLLRRFHSHDTTTETSLVLNEGKPESFYQVHDRKIDREYRVENGWALNETIPTRLYRKEAGEEIYASGKRFITRWNSIDSDQLSFTKALSSGSLVGYCFGDDSISSTAPIERAIPEDLFAELRHQGHRSRDGHAISLKDNSLSRREKKLRKRAEEVKARVKEEAAKLNAYDDTDMDYRADEKNLTVVCQDNVKGEVQLDKSGDLEMLSMMRGPTRASHKKDGQFETYELVEGGRKEWVRFDTQNMTVSYVEKVIGGLWEGA